MAPASTFATLGSMAAVAGGHFRPVARAEVHEDLRPPTSTSTFAAFACATGFKYGRGLSPCGDSSRDSLAVDSLRHSGETVVRRQYNGTTGTSPLQSPLPRFCAGGHSRGTSASTAASLFQAQGFPEAEGFKTDSLAGLLAAHTSRSCASLLRGI